MQEQNKFVNEGDETIQTDADVSKEDPVAPARIQYTLQDYKKFKHESTTKSLATAIIYPIILTIISAIIFSNGNSSLLGFLIAIVIYIAGGVAAYLGGFYLLIIPLPYIFLFKYGCERFYLSTTKKVVYAVLAIGSIFVALAIQSTLNF